MNPIASRPDEKIVIGELLISSKVIEHREGSVCLGTVKASLSPTGEFTSGSGSTPVEPLPTISGDFSNPLHRHR